MVLSSSRPSSDLKTSPVLPLRASSWAISGAIVSSATPRAVAIGCAGFASGPRKLNVVGTPSCFLTGATNLIAGWKTGAKKKVIPAFSNTCLTRAGDRSSRTPNTSSISEEPVLPEADREPCFRTGTPLAAATIEAMELIFTVPTRSPPVPTISTASLPVSSRSAFSSITSTRPESSSTVSPFERSAIMKAPICPSEASPAMICLMAQLAPSRERFSPAKRVLSTDGQLL